ncbi:hypothetical protein BABINDRAFT_160835 [Babjeviella inositovora NRRL Y-12698]|uniref:Thioredoxin domain-containing protein n=1 Tax=Babjeviella inositovora NRRL Y-12698 TaxID=984486 RepID=A0A1E3QS94_9ASCO|nr:uncharacterized protein BABINDRAFT_160835 [Babjeviella inositovora NRRL Y-12698]ODQ80573.1 hypothetical protein BABINDRAFT_160835 [Babjeviella inositovora NRRL Y-12698]
MDFLKHCFIVLSLTFCTLSSILEANDANFQNISHQKDAYTLVYFYAEQCRHCNALDPIYTGLADLFTYGDSKVQVTKVDGRQNEALRRKFDVISFPTIKLFEPGGREIAAYTGVRRLWNMAQWLTSVTGVQAIWPQSNVVKLNDLNFDRIASQGKSLIVVFMAPWFDADWGMPYHFFETAARESEDEHLVFATVDTSSAEAAAIMTRYRITRPLTILYFLSGETTAIDSSFQLVEPDLLEVEDIKALTSGRIIGRKVTIEEIFFEGELYFYDDSGLDDDLDEEFKRMREL